MRLMEYIIVAEGYDTKYDSTEWISLDVYGDYDSLGSWDCGFNERFWLAVL